MVLYSAYFTYCAHSTYITILFFFPVPVRSRFLPLLFRFLPLLCVGYRDTLGTLPGVSARDRLGSDREACAPLISSGSFGSMHGAALRSLPGCSLCGTLSGSLSPYQFRNGSALLPLRYNFPQCALCPSSLRMAVILVTCSLYW